MRKAYFEMTDAELKKAFVAERQAYWMEKYRRWYPAATEGQIRAKVRRRMAREGMAF